ncbi:hypothetical protein BGX26_001936 [Mortierella sp. AD094]|nr:hypothetical protein BGX26_001936 [Mortierella sp. AD094]
MNSSSSHRSTSLVTPSNKRPRCDSVSSDSDEAQLQKLRENLAANTGHSYTADFLLNITEPLGLKLQNGEMVQVLALPRDAKRFMVDTVVSVRSLRRQVTLDDTQAELRQALWAHTFGGLAKDDLSQYEYRSDDLCQRTFHKDGRAIAQQLAGALIQTRTEVMLILKVEVYGRTNFEDSHSHDLAFPACEPYKVEATLHDDTRRILIGAATWSALVTSAVMLTTGQVIVGPNNTGFHPGKESVVWVHKDWSRNSVVERQLLSKYHIATTIEPFAGVFFLFGEARCLPVTIRTLWEHYVEKEWSGIRAIACIFHELYHKKGLSIINTKSVLRSIQDADIDDAHVIDGMKSLIRAMGDQDGEDMIKANSSMSECLQSFAEDVQEVIATLNQDCVKKDIEVRIRRLLATRSEYFKL